MSALGRETGVLSKSSQPPRYQSGAIEVVKY